MRTVDTRSMTEERLSRAGRLAWRLRLAATRPARIAELAGPRSIGRADRGARIAAGRIAFRGHAAEAPGTPIWDVPIFDPAFGRGLQSFGWLDDLAATADPAAEALARDWTDQWLARFGSGEGPGWAPGTVGRRVRRWIDHADLLMPGDDARDRRLRRSLAAQVARLGRVWHLAPDASERLEALSALLLAGVALAGGGRRLGPALRGLEAEIAGLIAADGTIATRNPEELAEIFAHLARIRADLVETGHPVPARLAAALAAAAPVLRALRHADGSLARFHGGDGGVTGRLDQALAASGVAPSEYRDRAMGFARLSRGRTSVIVDAAAPPAGAAAGAAHASTLAFELTSGRRPLIVSCGAGRSFGDRWSRAGRATPSHSTLTLDGLSSARLEGEGGEGPLVDGPGDVRVERRSSARATGLIAGHDGYVATHGLTHVRRLNLSRDGRSLEGEDVIATVEREDEALCDRALDARGGRIPFRIRFHLHPDVGVRVAGDRRSATLHLRSGEVWSFSFRGAARLSVERSVRLDRGLDAPRPARQLVLSGVAVDYATRIGWTLAKVPETPDAVRDLVHDDRPVLV